MDVTSLLLALGFFALLAAFLWWNRSSRYVRAAQQAFRRGDELATVEAFEKAEAAGRLDANATASYAYLALKHDRVLLASAVLERALSQGRKGRPLKPGERNLLDTYRAMVLWKQDRLDDAVALLEGLLASGYRTTAVHGNLGYLLTQQGNLDRAEAVCREAADWDPDGKVILDNLASLLLERERWAEAAAVYERLLALEPRFPEAWHGAGWAALRMGDAAEAQRRWEKALELPFHALTTVERPAIEKALRDLALESGQGTN